MFGVFFWFIFWKVWPKLTQGTKHCFVQQPKHSAGYGWPKLNTDSLQGGIEDSIVGFLFKNHLYKD